MNELAGGAGAAVAVPAGGAVRLVNTFGQQVVDTWALRLDDPAEYVSVEHTRRGLKNLFVRPGDVLITNRRNPLLRLEEDTSPGRHDMLIPCCDPWLYAQYGAAPGHASCRDNFFGALSAAGFDAAFAAHVPSPLNLWMNIPILEGDRVEFEPPLSRPGDHVVLRALADVVVVFSACPMDLSPINGADRTPKAVHYELLGAA